MEKLIPKIGLFVFVFLAFAFCVSAWNCYDLEQWQPPLNNYTQSYGSWGDDGLLGGTTAGWLNQYEVPNGCTGDISTARCQDFCDGTTLREFYCSDRPGYPTETVIFWHDYENSNECYQVPEFGVVAAAVAIAGAITGVVLIRKRK